MSFIIRCDGCGKDITGIGELKLIDSTNWKARLSGGLMDEQYHFHNKDCLKKWLGG